MIPSFAQNGMLPPGIHKVSWSEFYKRYGYNGKRKELLEGLRLLLDELKKAGCSAVYVGGSFATEKGAPNDYDLCWKMDHVLVEDLDPVLLDYTPTGKQKIAQKYQGNIRGAEFAERVTGATYLEFFQHDRDGEPKGVVQLTP